MLIYFSSERGSLHQPSGGGLHKGRAIDVALEILKAQARHLGVIENTDVLRPGDGCVGPARAIGVVVARGDDDLGGAGRQQPGHGPGSLRRLAKISGQEQQLHLLAIGQLDNLRRRLQQLRAALLGSRRGKCREGTAQVQVRRV